MTKTERLQQKKKRLQTELKALNQKIAEKKQVLARVDQELLEATMKDNGMSLSDLVALVQKESDRD
ncbi:hypothetical protein [Fructobacillus evanidus]|uniref:Uncharacterized protein n=1 Tax=Fructobacillus evanidus TaxID=3064281 RepID=A0ABM9MWR9_9LACO|nr:unnamed protein product [Fructobacillus sp. LMG 32999]CAK1229498.1 unnamed protein product [Fructobacillus sp. LMG 32999]CAK1231089.1 unnamed protein product [Fructobacillus sp. LMG 32999]CAK1231200.1 unnamed protein product [Fructobacillus sp. LMG 32999]CAK1232299.1 unnamed protein product [Fructobacillus sp. LMG 32999]